jgi:hypothetical protein
MFRRSNVDVSRSDMLVAERRKWYCKHMHPLFRCHGHVYGKKTNGIGRVVDGIVSYMGTVGCQV